MSEADDRYSEDTVPWQIGQYRNHAPSRVGQTMLGSRSGKPVPIICTRDGPRVQWQSLDLQSYGDLAADTWDQMRTAQRQARRDEGEEVPEEEGRL